MRFLLVVLAGWVALSARGEDVIRVGVHDKPPYATKTADGGWDGIGVKLWKMVALETGLRYEFVEMPYAEILPAVTDGRLQAAVGEIEITAAAEKLINFTQPYIQSSTGVALQQGVWHPDWIAIVKEFFNWTLVEILLAISAGLVLVSALVWILERHHHVGHFRGGLSGFGSALWFSASTMTTVGYGDKTPSTFWGRVVSFVWMLAGVLLVAGFTAAVASSVATARVSEMIARPGDLARVSCGTLDGSVAQKYLLQHGIASRTYDSIGNALRALSKGEIQAVVADKIALRYLSGKMAEENPPVRYMISHVSFQNVFVGIPVHDGYAGYEAINVAVLNALSSPEWEETVKQWLGGGDK
ncbi:MAG: transporter substrate-binding domain-containing protein [Verrucomicrobiae bacterium]